MIICHSGHHHNLELKPYQESETIKTDQGNRIAMPISTQNHNSLTLRVKFQKKKIQTQHAQQLPQSETQQSLMLTPLHAVNPVPNSNPKPRFHRKPSNPTRIQINITRKKPRKPQNPNPHSPAFGPHHRNSHPNPKQAQVKKKKKNRNQTRRNEKKRNSLRKVTELAQDSNKAGHGHAFQESLRIILVRRSVQLRIRQAVLVPYLVPRQRHFSSNPKP